jgi:hypothetical protein
MDEGVVEGGKDVGNAKHQLTLSDLGAERDGVLLLGGFNFFGRLRRTSSKSQRCNPAFAKKFWSRKQDTKSENIKRDALELFYSPLCKFFRVEA